MGMAAWGVLWDDREVLRVRNYGLGRCGKSVIACGAKPSKDRADCWLAPRGARCISDGTHWAPFEEIAGRGLRRGRLSSRSSRLDVGEFALLKEAMFS